MTIITNNADETIAVGKKLGATIDRGDVIALYGDLGAGKTTIIRGIAQSLGIASRITSPTFTIVNEYPGKIPMFHFDMYRITDKDELFEIGWDEYLERNGICIVEWSENIEGAFPHGTIRIRIDKLDENKRSINIDLSEVHDANPLP